MTASRILYERGDYWVVRADSHRTSGYEVYRNEGSHSVRCAVIGYIGDLGLARAIAECDRRAVPTQPEAETQSGERG